MKTYLVGGAVRDKLLNYPFTEKDWVVIGESPESMIAQKFIPVGKDFPVFLHPKTREEYALARTERKIAPGYTGFNFHTAPEVTLEQDLIRRDLTINAIALSSSGQLIDPYGGQKDLKNRILRHVSPAFNEDPVRVLRIARFAARYAHLGFQIADETRLLMQQMVQQGEISHLVPERVWTETHKALTEDQPSCFFKTLKNCGSLAIIFPEINELFGVPQPKKYHPEIDTGIHALLTVDQAAQLTTDPATRFAALVHDLGKAKTSPSNWPSHRGHESGGLPILKQLCQRLRIPKSYKALAQHVMLHHTSAHKVMHLKPETLAEMLLNIGAFKKDNTLKKFLLACEADAKGRTGLENEPYPQASFIQSAQQAALAINTDLFTSGSLKGPQVGEAIYQSRIQAITDFYKTYPKLE
ncbi:MAG: multifunctional CCA addition/repair protein [Methylococcales bacterium]|nr:multifunctional CCA addition/repair protein [Methylococcales bacterium]